MCWDGSIQHWIVNDALMMIIDDAILTTVVCDDDGSFIHIRKRAHSQQYIRYQKLI